MSSQQQEHPQQGGREDFQPTSIRRHSNKRIRRSIPRLHHESIRMKELKNLQAELSNIIPDNNNNNSTTPSSVDALQYTHNNTTSRRASTSSTLSASSTTQTSSTISYSPYHNEGTTRPLPNFLDRYTTSYTILPKDIDVVELGLSIEQHNNDIKSNNRPKFRPYQPSSPSNNERRRSSYIPRRTSDESKRSTVTTTSSLDSADTIGSLPRRASKVDDFDNFLAFINDEEPPPPTTDEAENTMVDLKSILLDDRSVREVDGSERSTSPSKKILQSFRYTKKNSKNHQSQLPTYSFLIKDDNNGRDITLPNTKWWHYIFIFSLVSLLVCIIQLWVSYQSLFNFV